jgi:hypothetical protein
MVVILTARVAGGWREIMGWLVGGRGGRAGDSNKIFLALRYRRIAKLSEPDDG